MLGEVSSGASLGECKIAALSWMFREAKIIKGNWKKNKGIAMVKIGEGNPVRAEINWYEAHGIR